MVAQDLAHAERRGERHGQPMNDLTVRLTVYVLWALAIAVAAKVSA